MSCYKVLDETYFGNFALVRNIKVKCTFDKSDVLDNLAISKAVKIVKSGKQKMFVQLDSGFVYKKSIDARDKENIFLIYTVAFLLDKNIKSVPDKVFGLEFVRHEEPVFQQGKTLTDPPIVAGFGPSGMFCALTLARAGLNPIVLERGDDIDERTKKVDNYWKNGVLDTQSNVQFGEGGAGTFSDGKLLTRISDKLCRYVMCEFVRHGAPDEILYLAKPHIGTDNLRSIVKSIRREIISLGGKVCFNTCLTDIKKNSHGEVTSVIVNNNDEINCSALFLCVGHSARDTVLSLMDKGINIQPKPFSVGVRIEHLQKNIDSALYGKFAGCSTLGAASYTLSSKIGGRAVYSFCMCPGGVVVASASDNGQIVTNGMSYYARDGKNANSAIAVSIDTSDYGNTVSGAIEFQENIERKAFSVAGGDGTAPIQLLGDLFDGVSKHEPSAVEPTYTGKVALRNAADVFPKFIIDSLSLGCKSFEREISGFSDRNAVLTFPETRTSSPVRIPRNEIYLANGCLNLFPCGEGAGYAGGITSAAVDGLRAAMSFINNL